MITRMNACGCSAGGLLPSPHCMYGASATSRQVVYQDRFGVLYGTLFVFGEKCDFRSLTCLTRNQDWEWSCQTFLQGRRLYRPRDVAALAEPYGSATSIGSVGSELRTFTSIFERYPGFFSSMKRYENVVNKQTGSRSGIALRCVARLIRSEEEKVGLHFITQKSEMDPKNI